MLPTPDSLSFDCVAVRSRKRMQRYGFFPYTQNLYGKKFEKLRVFNSRSQFTPQTHAVYIIILYPPAPILHHSATRETTAAAAEKRKS